MKLGVHNPKLIIIQFPQLYLELINVSLKKMTAGVSERGSGRIFPFQVTESHGDAQICVYKACGSVDQLFCFLNSYRTSEECYP